MALKGVTLHHKLFKPEYQKCDRRENGEVNEKDKMNETPTRHPYPSHIVNPVSFGILSELLLIFRSPLHNNFIAISFIVATTLTFFPCVGEGRYGESLSH